MHDLKLYEFTTGQIRPVECVKEAWSLIKDEYWLLLAISIVGGLIAGFSIYVLVGAMICGIFRCYLTKIDGGKVNFDDLWSGFNYFWASLLVTILFVVPIVLYMAALLLTVYLPVIMRTISGSRVSVEEMFSTMLVSLAVDVIVAIIMVTIHSLLLFSYPLIVDRGISGVKAITLSARATLKNLRGVGGLIGVNLGLVILGYLACCFGVYLAIPLITATNLVAYRKVFPALSAPPSNSPPPPTAYSDLTKNQ